MSTPTPITYRDAGVDIDAGDALVERIKSAAARTRRPEVLAGLGGFGALCALPEGYRNPVLVSGTDGVGTKLKLATMLNRHNTIGIDLVAMCVNDIVVCGAEPLQFLDYYATGQLDVDVAAAVVEGIARGCEISGCALVGGETAEMPGMYDGSEYDLAGFCVGVVERDRIIDGSAVQPGDCLIGLASSGVHSNGFSLVRKLLERSGASLTETMCGDRALGDALLEPTRIYVKSILQLIDDCPVHAIAHITGGGLTDNIPRVLPTGTRARIDATSWALPPLFRWLQQESSLDAAGMRRTFNCGIGMVAVVPQNRVADALASLQRSGETATVIGAVVAAGHDEAACVEYSDGT